MTKFLWERIIFFCQLFGFGILHNTIAARIMDAVIFFVNIMVCAYCYFYVKSFVSEKMMDIWDITTVFSVLRVYFRLFAPIFILVSVQFKKRTVNKIVKTFDDVLPSIELAYKRSIIWYSVTWLIGSIGSEYLLMIVFHIRTNFAHIKLNDFIIITLLNTWTIIPIVQYLFIIKSVRLGVRNINDRITSIEQWKLLRLKWKKLRYLAIDLTSNVVGEIIIAYIICRIIDIILVIFLIYFYGYKEKNILTSCMFIIYVIMEMIAIFELFRQCYNCKLEVIFTKYNFCSF